MPKNRQIVNIINFIRAIEPRNASIDLLYTTKKQIELMEQYQFSGTFLIQYDALLLPEYQELLKALDPARYEIGIWYEVVQPLTEKCGIEWTGRYPWDWHCHCGFPIGYTNEQREIMIDEFFAKFREVFGYYPRVFGSWMFDSHTIRYMNDKYGLDAICNCKEQYGTDGYTLWGGYYGQAYYPARNNIFMPAQTEEQRLDVPLFRMLGSDPVYQYDFGMDPETGAKTQGVITLEPVYNGKGGGVPVWVDWFLQENYNDDCLTFGYAQAGQENPFGWDKMKDGLIYQFAQFDRLQKEGKIEIEPFGKTGRWFKETYKDTPASAITAHSAYDDPDKDSVWYCSKHYRVNLYGDHGVLRVRDIHLFDETYGDLFNDAICFGNEATYETLPWVDGNRHTGGGILSGLYLTRDGEDVTYEGKMVFTDKGNGIAEVRFGDVTFVLTPDMIGIKAPWDFTIEHRIGKDNDHMPSVELLYNKKMDLSYDGQRYSVSLRKGNFRTSKKIVSEGGAVSLFLCQND